MTRGERTQQRFKLPRPHLPRGLGGVVCALAMACTSGASDSEVAGAASVDAAPVAVASLAPLGASEDVLTNVERLKSTFLVQPPPNLAVRRASGSRVHRGVAARLQLVASGDAVKLDRQGLHFAPRFSKPSATQVLLPTRATETVQLQYRGESFTWRFLDARPANAQATPDTLVYRGLFDGATLYHVPTVNGTEEYVEFSRRPAKRELRYELDTASIGGFRQVGHVLEIVATSGDPIFHTTAPTVVDSTGHAVRGSLRLEGCAYDTNEAPPWGRRPVSPGASKCTAITSWDDSGLTYPLLVDPAWFDAGTPATKRTEHSAAGFTSGTYSNCASGCVLVTGGFTDLGTYTNTAELYSVSKGAWTSVASMLGANARRSHSSVQTGDGRVLVAGGVDVTTGAYLKDTMTYNPSTASGWVAQPDLPSGGRREMLLLQVTPTVSSGTTPRSAVLALGGVGTGNVSVANCDLFDATTNAWSAQAPMSVARSAFAAEAWPSGTPSTSLTSPIQSAYAVVAGGLDGSGKVSSSVEVFGFYFNSRFGYQGLWTTGAPLAEGRSHLASSQIGDAVLFAGGTNGGSASNAVEKVPKISPKSTIKLTSPLTQKRFLAVGSTTGVSGAQRALFIGGQLDPDPLTPGEPALPSARTDLIPPDSTVMFTNLLTARRDHQATSLPNGNVLVTGGVSCTVSRRFCRYTILGNELFAPQTNGASCTAASECASLNCVDGVCCDAACSGQCAACDVAGKLGTCTPIVGSPHGTRSACSGSGTPCAGTCNGTLTTACTYPLSTPEAPVTCGTASCPSASESLAASICVAGGTCQPPTSTVVCGIYKCDATAGKCRTSCTDNAHCTAGFKCNTASKLCESTGALGALCTSRSDCSAGGFCTPGEGTTSVCCKTASCGAGEFCASASISGKEGTCVRANGTACATSADCGSGFCTDGVCCNNLCNGQCEACDVSGALGKCISVKGATHGSRTPCSTGGGNLCRALVCDGVDTLKCAAFKNGVDTECAPGGCGDGIETETSYCDGYGACKLGGTRACAPFSCGNKACKRACTATADCAKGYSCNTTTSQCVPLKSTCSDDGAHSVPVDKSAPISCAPYVCDLTTGDCFAHCASGTQCGTGAQCEAGVCTTAPPDASPTEDSNVPSEDTPQIPQNGASSTCAVHRAFAGLEAESDSTAAPWGLLLAAALTLRRWRRASNCVC